MSETTKSLRIDWFDGTVIEETRPSTSQFTEDVETPPPPKLQECEKKPIGFKRLYDISQLVPPILNLELSNRPGFWSLLDTDLKGDFIVLLVKIFGLLYKSVDPKEKSKIGFLLRTKFEKSGFLMKLRTYLSDLPRVKIVDKKMNMQLWNDVESFYFNVLNLCESIFRYGGHTKEFLEDLCKVVEMAEISASGVEDEHTETISEKFYEQIYNLKTEILKSIMDNSEEETSESSTVRPDPNSFRNLNIFPNKEDLLGENKVEIVPNIINGAYSSVEHYLDLQFKLLREDCFGPLREGICKYLKNPSKRRHENIRVYPKVRIIRTYVSNNKVGHLVDIAWAERVSNTSVDCRKCAYSKRLMFGSLLLFTSDNFQNILCASVLDSNLDLLKYGYIAVSFESCESTAVFSQTYLMVESEIFFEPYHRVLKVFKESRYDSLPMKKYIVEVQKESSAPAYLTPETMYSIQNSSKNDEISFPVLDTNQWPSPQSFGLDQSQFDAYKFALTREFAVIQGPPGTGKTYLGVKIASTILKNVSLEGTPMLVICYTNHALDQFLEGILNVTDSIVRLGSQSKSKILEPYNLNAMRTKIKCKFSYLYAKKRSELEKIFKIMTDLQTEIEKCEKEIISYKTIKKYLKIGEDSFELKKFDEDCILTWLFGHSDQSSDDSVTSDENNDLEDWEKQFDEVDVSDKIETCFSEQWALKEIESMEKSIQCLLFDDNVNREQIEWKNMVHKLQNQVDFIKKRLGCFKNYMAKTHVISKENEIPKEQNPYKLTIDERWKIYFAALEAIKENLMMKMNKYLNQHNSVNEELEEVSTLIDSEVVKSVRVVAVTTTLAARRHDLMNRLQCPIVIVEEAAEVLEAHIVASLTDKCQHLILIGDHKQLRPNAAHYELAKNYNLEISLFERMIRNGVHARTLTTQRRMRANFVKLLVPVIYDRLDSHPTVLSYPNVRGMRNTLFFYTHDAWEDSEEDSWSHKNTLEAKWCLSLANYLRKMKYDSKDITILTTYNGQATFIKEISKRFPLLQDVKITVVDNYQGEENRIVILSLVRSNRHDNIGFLAAANRICVALSRAKEGFYMFGNMSVLRSASQIWRHIHNELVAQNAIGKEIVLQCEQHKDKHLHVSNLEDIDNCLKGSCLRICNQTE
ncbi:NFX1-type zinc finger-containing protein 1 [Bicyclus anynana]|uniref:NFX1-type zinc finger-containing protein 1 n=1 Tax=Bicyclus anynana TaxID=110368 RepID=A0ABM3LQ54_BICAN|nr:NFX1-type zinc finger-containing protein 1 [Bicyclus anynana]